MRNDEVRDLADVFVMLADSLRPDFDVLDTMHELVDACVGFTTAVAAGVVLADSNGTLNVVASTSERTTDVEEAQLGTRAGPCLECFKTGHIVEVESISTTRERWPEFADEAQRSGYRASFGAPLTLRQERLGALNVFYDRIGTPSDIDVALIEALAQIATLGIVQHRRLARAQDLNTQLQRALESRIIIEQAKGVLAYQHNIEVDHAFVLLRRHARENHARLRDTAQGVVNLTTVITT